MRAWDEYTMQHEPIPSIDLMERAGTSCADWILQQGWKERKFRVLCGKGNNGGDGLVIARRLHEQGFSLSVHVLESHNEGSEDFQINLRRFHRMPHSDVHYITSRENFLPAGQNDIIVDALFGSGLNK